MAVPNLRRLVPVLILIKSINFFMADSSKFLRWVPDKGLIPRKLREGEGIFAPSTGKQPGVADVKQAVTTTYNLHDHWPDTCCLLQ